MGMPGGPMGQPQGSPVAGGGHLIAALLAPCATSCRDAAEECRDTAQDNALACGQSTCATEITSARAACKPGQTPSGCRSALTALANCLSPCVASLQTANDNCKTAAQTCKTACQTTATP